MGRPRDVRVNEVTQEEMDLHVPVVAEVEVASEEGELSLAKELEEVNTELDLLRKQLEDAKRDLVESKKAAAGRELDDAEIASIGKSISRGNSREALKDKIEAMCAHDSEPVTGKFMNLRAPGQAVKLTYAKYASDQDKWTTFEHNQKYTIPRGFADQINDHYAKITYNKSDGENQALDSTPRREQIYAFVSQSY